MGAWLECGQCQRKFHTDENEDDRIRTVGTVWDSAFAVDCPGCGNEVRFDVGTGGPLLPLDEMIDGELNPAPVTTVRVPIAERVQKLDVREWWVQRYIKTHPEHLGIEAVQGPFITGPDFKIKLDGQWFITEAEVRCKGYMRDGHHKDQRWSACQVLIVLEQEEPAPEVKALLPSRIIHIDHAPFTEWYREAAKEYALMKEATAPSPEEKEAMAQHHRTLTKLRWIAKEFMRRFADDGFHECFNHELPIICDNLAFDFIAQRKKLMGDETPTIMLKEIPAEEVDAFYEEVAPDFELVPGGEESDSYFDVDPEEVW